jgi:RNA polymerase sigma factor (sigma-70 family)
MAVHPLNNDRFADLYGREALPLLRFFVGATLDAETAADLTAETFASAYASRRRFEDRGEGADTAWLYAIARHELSRYYRRGKVSRRALKRLSIEPIGLSTADLDRIEELIDLETVVPVLKGALARLPEDQRRAVLMRVSEDYSYQEIADALSCSEETARARVSRGLRRMAREIGRKGGTPWKTSSSLVH